MTDSGGMFSKLINPHTAKPADPHTAESTPEAPRTPLPAKSQGSPQKSTGKSKPTHQSTRQSTHQPTRQFINQSTSRPPTHIVDRPKAFYITEGLDEKLDQAVTYLQKKHGINKVDRSVIVNALLDNDALWTDEALDQLVERVVSQLTSRLMSR
jgi:hypothetical protein